MNPLASQRPYSAPPAAATEQARRLALRSTCSRQAAGSRGLGAPFCKPPRAPFSKSSAPNLANSPCQPPGCRRQTEPPSPSPLGGSQGFPLGSLRAITLPSGFPTAHKPDVVLSQSLFTCCFLSLESSTPKHLQAASLLCSKSSLKGLPSLTVPFKPAPPGTAFSPSLLNFSLQCLSSSNIPSKPFIHFACLSLHLKCMLQKSMDFF